MAISELDDVLGLSLFDNPFIEEKKEELIDKGVIRFQAPLDLDMIKNLGFYTPTKKGVLFLDYNVSVTDSGYLVQINDITERKKAEKLNRELLDGLQQSDEDLEVFSEDTRLNEFRHAIRKRPWLNLVLRYGAAILVVIVAFWLYEGLTAWLGPGLPTYILFYPAVIVVALLMGLGPGLLATFTAVIVAGIWILPPSGQFSMILSIDQFGAVIFSSYGSTAKQCGRTLPPKPGKSRCL